MSGSSVRRAVWHLPRQVLMTLVRGYRLLLSPWLGSACRFTPTCSAYSLQALQERGAVAGTCLTVYRLVRCQPWCEGGNDPVPPARADGANRSHALFSRLVAKATTIPSEKTPL